MRLFLVSVLAVLGTAHGAAVNYQYRNQLLSYSPSRGEFPVQAGVSQAFVRYIDAQGTQHLIPYQYQEPLFAVRRLSNSENDTPNVLLRSGFSQSSSQEQQQQEMEASFRAWCEQRYNDLRSQIDELRAQGMKPSPEMIEQLKPLENMLKTTDVNYESPEMQIAREEQLRLWNEARQQVEAEEQRLRAKQMELIQQAQQTQQVQQSQDTQQAGPSAFQTKATIPQTEMPVEETAEQKRAREEHLRIYNEQLQQIEAQRLRSQAAESNKATIRENAATQTKTSWQGTESAQTAETNKASFQSNAATQTKTYWQGAETTQQADATPEVVRATQEHLRIWNEAKLRAEKQGETTQTNQGFYQQNEWTDAQSAQPEIGQRSDFNPAQFVKDTPEVVRAREEHLRLVNEAKLRAESTSTNNAYDDGSYKQDSIQSAKETAFFKYNPGVQPTNMAATETKTVFINQVADTPEVIRAREEHLRAVNEAKLKAQASEQYKQESTQQFEQKQNQGFWKTTEYTQNPIISNEQIMDTPEVIRAREEHLRIFNEAQRQAEKQQQIESSKLQQSSFSQQGFKAYQSTDNKADFAFSTEQERMLEAERLREAERLAAEERMREERLLEAERQREAERIALEAKIREEEMQREMLRLKEEERFQEIERMRLAREEAERLEMERIEEAKRLTTANTQESVTSQASTQKQSSEHFGQTKTVIPTTVQFAAVVPGVQQSIPASYILKNQYQNNPFLLRTVQQSSTPLIAAQKPADYKFKYVENPFLIHYTEGAQGSALKSGISTSSGSSASFSSASQSSAAAASQSSSSFKSESVQQIGLRSDAQPTKQQATTGTASDSAFSSSFKFNYGGSSDIAALEKATREHFRAHEEALEQLRLARLKNPDNKDCN